jgi:large subunit ribosomal protein L4
MYDLAWRTALSMRYRKGELIICEDGMDFEYRKTQYGRDIFQHHGWGKEGGRSLLITSSLRGNLIASIQEMPEEGRVLEMKEVDVKDLLELGRVIIEKSALDEMLAEHQSDLVLKTRSWGARRTE